MKLLGLIPARGGSKGVPRKNIRFLAGKPLIQYSIESALGSKYLTDVVLSTEDPEIAEIGRACGAEVPFLRPVELALDTTPTFPVVQLFIKNNADTLITILSVPFEYNPHWVYFMDNGGNLTLSTGEPNPIPRRQELPPAFHREGSIYITKSSVVLDSQSLYGSKVIGYLMDSENYVNINTLSDWEKAEKLISEL